ncbi:MAG TPA: hypothetical protein VM925_30645, partial [Labilithrix sp.]|nr:hypothetical protein [Labilithrix sp.]
MPRASAFRSRPAFSFVGALVIAAIAACGPGEGARAPGAPGAPTPGVAPSATGATTAPAPSVTPTAPAPSSSTATAPPGGPMKPLAPTAMEARLREIGVDPAALPALNKLDAKT